MSTPTTSTTGVQRLIDMIVQEVSLVDKAANKRRFLIVKRNNMNKSDASSETNVNTNASLTTSIEIGATELPDTIEYPSTTEDDNSPTEPLTTQGVLDFDTGDDDAGDAHPLIEDSVQTPLNWATKALEALTDVVENLDTNAQEETQTQALALAQGLQGLASRIESMGPKASTIEPNISSVSTTLNSVRETLQRIEQGLQSRVETIRPTPGQATISSTPRQTTEVTQFKNTANQKLEAALDTILNQLGGIREILSDQQRRLTRVEKRFGLPNSAPVGETPQTKPREEIGWPLDLNYPQDRDNVEKMISFHDI